MAIPLVIYGSGGFGREVALAVRAMNAGSPAPRLHLRGFLDDDPQLHGRQFADGAVLGGFDWLAQEIGPAGDVQVFVAIGDQRAQASLVARIRECCPRVEFCNIIHPDTTVPLTDVTLGEGNYIAAGCRLTSNVRLGDFNVVNLNTVLAHDVTLGNHCQVNPGAVVNGQVTLRDYAMVGARAVIIPRVVIGEGAVVGLGAVVGTNVRAGDTVVGNPARVIRKRPVAAP